MFTRYSGEQINQIPEGYVQAMGQSPIASLIHSGLQGYQMGRQMEMADAKAKLDERQTAAAEKSANASASKAASDEAKLALATEGKAIEGQAALDKANLEARKFELEILQNAQKALQEEAGGLETQLGDLRKTDEYKKGDKNSIASEQRILSRKITLGERLAEYNDKLSNALKNPTPQEKYRLPSNINLSENDDITKKYRASEKKYNDQLSLAQRAPGVALVPPTPVAAANEFKGQLTPEQLKRLSRFTTPFGATQ